MKKALALLILILICTSSFSQTHDENVRKLLKVTNSEQMMIQMLDAIIPQFQMLVPDVPEEYWQEFYSMFDYDEFIELLVPVYLKYYSNDDILALLAFYKTPIGKKMVRVSADISTESMAVGQKWGEQLGMKIMNKLRSDGYLEI